MAKTGKVWLVGAGPGDPGLLTLRGKAALGRADVVYYDRLVNPGILLFAKRGAPLIDVGKEPGGKRTEQSEICKKLISSARSGREVVRLKGGDPFVFGRGGEEVIALARAGIPLEVVSGITAGIAAPAQEGIPVTHRGVSTELQLKIGARAEGSVGGRTLVGYMSVEGLGDFLAKAMDAGFAPKTPAALISRGTCVGQKAVFSTVGNLETEAKRAHLKAPAVVVVGAVVDLRKLMRGTTRGCLSGKRVILTVSESMGAGWREVFENEGAEVWSLPMTEIDSLPPKKSWIQEIQKSDWIILTSGAAARTLPQIMGDLRTLHGKRIAVVGKSTAAILGALGLRADFVGPGPGSMALARAWPGKKSESILHLTGNAEEGGLVKVMRRMGYPTQRIEVYRNRLPPCLPKPVFSELRQAGADWVVFASGTAAQRLRRLVGKTAMPRTKAAVIGPATAQVARRSGWKVAARAKEISADGVLSAILRAP